MSPLRARFLVLSAAVLFSTGGAAIKATTLTSWQVAGLRSALALVVFGVFLPGARRRPSRRALVNALAYATTMILFVRATKLTTSANAIFLQSTAPIWIVFLAPRLLGEAVRLRDLVFLGVLAVGLVLFFLDAPTAQATAPDPTQGNLVAVGSGVAWAFTIVTLRWLERDEPGASGPARPSSSATYSRASSARRSRCRSPRSAPPTPRRSSTSVPSRSASRTPVSPRACARCRRSRLRCCFSSSRC